MFYGHLHPCNHATFNVKGDVIASRDSSSVMKLWGIQKSVPPLSIDADPHPANQLIFDRSGCLVVLASSDGSVKAPQLEFVQLSSHRGEVPGVLLEQSRAAAF
ncbi:uncharacterized protein [Phaenicophaeus curvirostris]|uniref:uncharacterized protein n=1 Tax=Phaenicophaeus curvirostris TaxID=33595 RepID=UPI0037F0DCDC